MQQETFPRTDCDIVAHAIRRTQPDAETLLQALGLDEYQAVNVHTDAGAGWLQ